jgi:hypothetical protein
MKKKTVFLFALVLFALTCCILFSQTDSFGTENNTLNKPSILIPESLYKFSPVLEGTEIIHDFIVQNKGTAPLKIEKVRTGWGCAAVSYTRQIPPGGEGKITIKVNTNGYGGRTLTKRITVNTDSPVTPLLNLTVIGNINNFVRIIPDRVILNGFIGDPIVRTVKIIPEENYPFKMVGDRTVRKKYIRYELEEANLAEKTEYVLTVANLKKQKGRYFETIRLKTDSKIRPEISIRVYGNILDRPSGGKK